jgi:hypothetical protein
MFLDVPRLLQDSIPRQRASWFGYGIGALLLVVLMTALLVARSDANRELTQLFSAGAMLGIIVAMTVMGVSTVKRHRAAQAMVDAAGELAQLRRWPQAALVLEQVLSRPMPGYAMRTQALVYLSSVLSRYHRFEDAIVVHNHLLDNDLVDDAIGFGVRAARAMAMLRDDHLFDADRAISELRRLQGPEESAPLALVEIFRDVKTGHPDEAIQLFETKLPALRDQLGHRLADAYALAARAYDLRERKAEAHDAWAKATLLAPAGELVRRYPEVKSIAENYPASPAPAEAMG